MRISNECKSAANLILYFESNACRKVQFSAGTLSLCLFLMHPVAAIVVIMIPSQACKLLLIIYSCSIIRKFFLSIS